MIPDITPAIIRTLWPRAPQATCDAISNTCHDVFTEEGFSDSLQVAHFMAQISHECGAGTIVRENMNYSYNRLLEIFGVGHHSAKVTPEEAQALAGHPMQIAERVYGLGNPSKAKELGNTQPGDGYKYRGNGMLQLTGRGSHKRIGDMIGVDLEANPEQLENPAISFKVAAAEFVALNCLPAAEQDNIALVTRRVNGGSNGLAERTVWLRKWKRALDGVEEPAWKPRAADPEPAKLSLADQIIEKGGPAVAVVTPVVSAVSDWKIAAVICGSAVVGLVAVIVAKRTGAMA